MQKIVDFKSKDDDFEVEYEIIPIVDISSNKDKKQSRILKGEAEVDERISEINEKISELNKDIDRLTNHADGLDYAIAVSSGIITGIIDAAFVGEWNFSDAKAKSNEEINNKVISFAKKDPRYEDWCDGVDKTSRWKKRDPNRKASAVEFLEEKYVMPGDNDWKFEGSGVSASSHHLDDFCHHPTLVGMVCCILVQFSGKIQYHTSKGNTVSVEINEYGNFVSDNPKGKCFAGIINWFFAAAKTLNNQKGHLMSDIAGSISAKKEGAGIPGTFISTLKELSVLPCFKNTSFAENLRKAYQNGIGSDKKQLDMGAFNSLFEGPSSKFDSRTENAVMHELKRQAFPVILNEILVRASYFIRHFIAEVKDKRDLNKIDWNNVIPFNNRTIVRMMTIATGTFTAIDMADAAIHAATKSVDLATFLSNMILRVNFVGVGRFAVAVTTDIGMGISREKKRNERIMLQNEHIRLLGAKLYYREADMWIAAENTQNQINAVWKTLEETIKEYELSYNEIKESLESVGEYTTGIEKNNPGLIDDMLDILNE